MQGQLNRWACTGTKSSRYLSLTTVGRISFRGLSFEAWSLPTTRMLLATKRRTVLNYWTRQLYRSSLSSRRSKTLSTSKRRSKDSTNRSSPMLVPSVREWSTRPSSMTNPCRWQEDSSLLYSKTTQKPRTYSWPHPKTNSWSRPIQNQLSTRAWTLPCWSLCKLQTSSNGLRRINLHNVGPPSRTHRMLSSSGNSSTLSSFSGSTAVSLSCATSRGRNWRRRMCTTSRPTSLINRSLRLPKREIRRFPWQSSFEHQPSNI